MKQLLLYNVNGKKEEQILNLCSSLHIAPRKVETVEFLESLGALLRVKGMTRLDIPFGGFPFTDEMLVFHDLKDKELDSFLEKYRTRGIEKIALKAQTTLHNIGWNSMKLHDELTQENKAMSQY